MRKSPNASQNKSTLNLMTVTEIGAPCTCGPRSIHAKERVMRLMHPEQSRQRLCIRCEREFRSMDFGNRCCQSCDAKRGTTEVVRVVALGSCDNGRIVRKKLSGV